MFYKNKTHTAGSPLTSLRCPQEVNFASAKQQVFLLMKAESIPWHECQPQ